MKKLLTIFLALITTVVFANTNNAKNKGSSQSSNVKADIIKEIIQKTYIDDEVFKSLEELKKDQPNNVDTDVSRDFTHYQAGTASYYGEKWNGRRTSNGEVFNTNLLTAAHRSLPFGTIVRVTNQSNGRSVIVRINDRGPFKKGRVIDLSKAAFESIESINRGLTKVKLEIIRK